MTATLSDYILDNGLNALQSATHIHVTNLELTTYADVMDPANSLSVNASPIHFINPPTVRSPNGSKVANVTVTIAGELTGEAHFWYFLDQTNTRLLARGALASSVLYTFNTFDGGVTIRFPAYIAPGDNVQIPSVASNGIVDPWVLNNGLLGLIALANKMYVCSALPSTYTQATSTFALGNKDMGVGGVYSGQSIAAGVSPVGRQITSNSLTGGNVTASGTATHYAVVDSVNSRFLVSASLGLGGPAGVTAGQHFTLGGFTTKLVSS
jgi:hypothetical protein